jgi:glyoxylase-like metal-dependent hydrolase (beta-lactamase superfamily II)
MNVIVDNSAGGDSQFADEVTDALRARGLEVELRRPPTGAMFDTAAHLVHAGTVLRVSERPDRATLAAIEEVVRAALEHRPSLRRRTRSVPVRLGETERALEWIDVFG